MGHKSQKLSGAAGFDAYYAEAFGGRWPALRAALSLEPAYAEWSAGGGKPYYLDTGSVLAAMSLPVAGAKTLLDLCAAPGGKSLITASRMDEDASLICNDRSAQRKIRLARVLDESLRTEIRERVTVTCSDGAKWCLRQQECFDRILLDAPCSSERHVLADPAYLGEWSPSRIKTLSVMQWALLSSAYRMLVPGGYLLYATCALSTDENDAVVAKLTKKFETARFIPVDLAAVHAEAAGLLQSVRLPDAERTEYGCHVLPDAQNGAGPLYFSLIQKLPQCNEV